MNFKTVRLDDIINFNPKRPITKGSDAPFIEMAAIPEGNRDISYTFPKTFKGSGSKFKNGDTLFARITPCLENGKTAKVSCLKDDEKGHGSTEFIVLSAKEPEYDKEFVYYLCRWPKFREFAKSRMEGTSGRQRVDWKALAESEWKLPDRESRKRIGYILKQIDDKIANNNRINQTLEEIAQAMFKSWFVDFEPVKAKIQAKADGTNPQLAAMCAISGKTTEELQQLPAEKYDELAATTNLFPDELVENELRMIPKGWKVSKLGNVTNFLSRGLTPKYADEGVTVINQRCIRNQTIDFSNVRYHDEEQRAINTKQVLESDILINSTGVGTLGRVAIVKRLKEKTTVDTHVTIVRADSNIVHPEYLGYFLLNKESIIEEMGEGSTGQTELKRAVLLEMDICVPDMTVQNRFSEIVKRVISKVSNNEIENHTLISIRDLLIPKLLSGHFEFE